MEQFAADKKLETFEDFDRVYDECLNYLREENIHVDLELKDFDRKVPYIESVEKKIKLKNYTRGTNTIIEEETNLFDEESQDNESDGEKNQIQCFLSKENNINNEETITLEDNDPYYAVIEEKPKSKAYLPGENNNIGQSDIFDADYKIVESNHKPKSHLHDRSIQNEDKQSLYNEKDDVNANIQDKIKSNTNLNKENILNNEETKVFNEKEPHFNGIEESTLYQVENELKSNDSIDSVLSESRTDRLRKLSHLLPKIIITQSNSSLNVRRHDEVKFSKLNKDDFVINDDKKSNERRESRTSKGKENGKKNGKYFNINYQPRPKPYGEHPKRLVCKGGVENVALISNVPFERIRLLNDTFHTLINLRWRWIVTGTIVVHFAIWLVFAVFWYIAAYAHYDFEPNPPPKSCVTGGHDFLTIFLASVESQTTIGFGDRAIDEECPESIFLLIMQLILGTGLSGVLTCVVYAKLTRPEKLSKDGVGFSKRAVISVRDGRLCLMMRAWDLNYDHIISSEFTAHFINTHKTKEGEIIRYYAQCLTLQQRQFLLWPVTLVHVIDSTSPLYKLGPDDISNDSYEITLSLKGASASMGTFTQSQTSYLPSEILWGYRFPPVVKYDTRKRKYVIEQNKLDIAEAVDTPFHSAQQIASGSKFRTPHSPQPLHTPTPDTPGCFSEQISSFHQERSSSFRRKGHK